MSDQFISEIRIMSFGFPPKGWALCDGQLLPINQNQALFSLLGTTYGGDGRVNFGLPNLQGRVPMHMGNGHTLGELGGEGAHTLSIPELPQHTHPFGASTAAATVTEPSGNVLAATSADIYESPGTSYLALDPAGLATVGGGQPHENEQPFLVLSFCIALQGIFPSQT